MKKANGFTFIEVLATIVIFSFTVINEATEYYKMEMCPTVTIMGKSMQTCEILALDSDQNLRYVGTTPNNYVWFNKDDEGNQERWRIIGIFNGQVKLIRDEYYSTTSPWDDNGTNYFNDWATATLNSVLNDQNTGYIRTIEMNDPVSYSYIDLTYEWNIGGTPNHDNSTRSDFYKAERSENISPKMTNHLWTGAIGLMYPSDYGYSTSGNVEICNSTVMSDWWFRKVGDKPLGNETAYTECALKSWLYDSNERQWTITPHSEYPGMAFCVHLLGRIDPLNVFYDDYKVRPVIFLNPEVKIVGGLGTFEQPYELGV